ncbi:MAG: acetyl-CoA C-acetyltransferase [Gammaproteobacteria bacterium]|nr:acetyl-CoA C-acetyltransferase [Gammaproteobacteria bacterium]
MHGRAVYVIDGARTPFLKARGVPGPLTAAELAMQAGQALLERQGFEPQAIDEVVLGCTIAAPEEANIARVVALRLGCGNDTPAWTVHRNCASGMQGLASAAESIANGHAQLVLAGGTDAMSHAPLLLDREAARWLGQWRLARGPRARLRQLLRLRPAAFVPVIALLRGLTDPVAGLSMGQTAELLARRFGISREAMDQFAARSHQRVIAAHAAGRLAEVAPAFAWDGRWYERDDGVRADAEPVRLARLRPAFDRGYGMVTAGNSAQVTDGAALVLLASEEAVKKRRLEPIGRIVDFEWAGLDPAQMGLGPVYAATALLRRRRVGFERVEYWEINEAFAAQVLACLAAGEDDAFCRGELDASGALGAIDPACLNVDGGAIALGHPIGASGARIVLHLLHVLQAARARLGVATLCVGGGQGGAMLVERE